MIPQSSPTTSSRRAWFTLIALTMLSVIGMTIIFPVMPFLVQSYLPANTGALAIWVGVLEGVSAFCAFLAAPFLGGLSDRIGRRPVIIIAAFGAVAGYVTFGVGGALWVLLLGRIIQGITAGDMPAMFAYVADITPPEKRAQRFGLLGALNGIGFMIGPALGGMLAGIDLRLPVFATAIASLLVALVAIFALPESLPQHKRTTRLAMENLHPVRVIVDAFRRPELRGLLTTLVLLTIPFTFFASNFSVLAIDAVSWNATQIGFLLAVIGVLDIIVQGGVLSFLLPRIGERRTIMIGIAGQAVGIAALAITASLLTQPWILILGVLMLGACQGLTQAPLDGLLSSAAGDDEQGKVAGAMQSTTSGIQMLGPLVAGLLYSGIAHAAPYAIGFALIVTALLVFRRVSIPRRVDARV